MVNESVISQKPHSRNYLQKGISVLKKVNLLNLTKILFRNSKLDD